MRFVITGAGGYIGRGVVDALIARGIAPADLVLITRSPPKLAARAAEGAEVRFGDYADPASLAAAFAGGDRILLLNTGPETHPTWAAGVAAERRAIEIAAAAGIGYAVLQSSLGAHPSADPQDADDLLLEDALKQSGMRYAILRTGAFADSRGRDAKRAVKSGILTTTCRTAPRAQVARDDVIAAAVAALIAGPGEDRAYILVGPTVARDDLLRLLGEIRGAPLDLIELDDAAYTRLLIDRGRVPEVAARGVASDHRRFAGQDYPPCDIEGLTGRPPRSLLDLLDAHRHELRTGEPAPGERAVFG